MLLAWFDRDGRSLDFRASRDPDPWAVLVSEVMAQQTQVSRVVEKWRSFMDRFPTPAALASAPAGVVSRAWPGLGYNRRAIDLQRAARAIVAAGGCVPDDVEALLSLPGVGPYTARAVAAIAFGRPVGAVDVNVRRVVGRLIGADPSRVRPDAAQARTGGARTNQAATAAREGATIQAAADALVDPTRAGDWTHALMDLGATVCRPARPACDTCPVTTWCAFAGRVGFTGGFAGSSAGPSAGAAETRPPAPRPLVSRPPAPRRPVPRRPVPRPATNPPAAIPFEATTRWLRGRIVDRLCSVPPGTSVTFDGPLGLHAVAAVSAALAALAADGLVELELGGGGAARLAGERP